MQEPRVAVRLKTMVFPAFMKDIFLNTSDGKCVPRPGLTVDHALNTS
jgi:hypothetical protein